MSEKLVLNAAGVMGRLQRLKTSTRAATACYLSTSALLFESMIVAQPGGMHAFRKDSFSRAANEGSLADIARSGTWRSLIRSNKLKSGLCSTGLHSSQNAVQYSLVFPFHASTAQFRGEAASP